MSLKADSQLDTQRLAKAIVKAGYESEYFYQWNGTQHSAATSISQKAIRDETDRLIAGLILIGSIFLQHLQADQPIMNMMPRWNGGYGMQTLLENIDKQDLKLGDSVHTKGLSEQIQTLHLQGVYTWTRAVRMTFKLPYTLAARKESLNEFNQPIVEKDQGWGDLTLALPLKRYFNLATRTGNWSITPQAKIP